jgi:cytochrome c-type biogenesis protein CcmH/NrfG
LKCIQKAVELNPGHFLLWLELGHCQQALHLVGAAENSFQQARQLNRDCVEANQALARISETGLFQRLRGRWRELFKR